MDTQTPTDPTPPQSRAALEAQLAELEALDELSLLGEREDEMSRPSADRLILSGDEATDNQGNPVIRIGEQV